MAKKYGTSDLGSDWITVPRKFRGRKPTSSDTHLAYITRPEMKALGLLSQAKKMQVGPANIPSFDDSGYDPDWDPTKYDPNTAGSYRFGQRGGSGGGRTLADIQKDAQKSILSQAKSEKKQAPGSLSVIEAKSRVTADDHGAGKYNTKVNPWELPKSGRYGSTKKPTGRDGSFPSYDKDKDTGAGDTKTTVTPDPCQGRGRNPDGSCKSDDPGVKDKCAGKSTDCPSDRPNGKGICDSATGEVDFSSCTADPSCPYGKDPATGKCKDKPGDGNGGDPPSLKTILQPDETPMLQTLTNEMDLRNMLTNVLNKNNPLFKQARTRALQAMAGRGIVNSSMAEEAVMNAVMNVAMPIATRVIDDMQRVMAANVNASNAFKQALNEAYYSELIKRVDAANEWNLNKMLQSQEWARSMLTAKTGAAGIKDEDAFKRYMDMLSGKTYGNI